MHHKMHIIIWKVFYKKKYVYIFISYLNIL